MRVKYPRTKHLPWSPGKTDDDEVLANQDLEAWFNQEVVVTEKMDGENTTLYRDYIHARSLHYESRLDRYRLKSLHASMAHLIPENLRVCGENLTATHSIKYTNLSHFFLVFSVWDGMRCYSWDQTKYVASRLGLDLVPVLWQGRWNRFRPNLDNLIDLQKQEGYVVRPAGEFLFRDFGKLVGKYVRKGHVAEIGKHWTRRQIEYNGVTGT